MKHLNKTYNLISGTSVIISITVQAIVFKLLISAGVPIHKTLFINLITASSIYIILYRILILYYEQIGWKLVLKRFNIEGVWYQEFVSKLKVGYIRRGRTVITQSCLTINMNAQNYDIDFDPASRTLWQSVALNIDETGYIILAFKARRAGHAIHDSILDKDGLMYLQIELDNNNKPWRIIGEYADSVPSDNRGAVTFYRRPKWADEYDKSMNKDGGES
jgi:hypothetical protein